ncbi:MAG: PaaI family thioesterase [Thermodesulfobacteriota bacterium]|nr:PaaI family thioesterase [Thermodesulfobacteriota bacterium]
MARNMDKWLGDGGMVILEELGVNLTGYGEGWVEGTWSPTSKACNPNGPVQGGISAVVTDAVMAFATLSALERGENCSLIDMKLTYLRGAVRGDQLKIRGEVSRMARTVAFCKAIITANSGEVIVEASGTNLLRRVNINSHD